jgi:hypothetical protein
MFHFGTRWSAVELFSDRKVEENAKEWKVRHDKGFALLLQYNFYIACRWQKFQPLDTHAKHRTLRPQLLAIAYELDLSVHLPGGLLLQTELPWLDGNCVSRPHFNSNDGLRRRTTAPGHRFPKRPR